MVNLDIDAISLEPAVGVDNPYSIKEEDMPRVLKEYDKLTDYLLECFEKKKDIHFFTIILTYKKDLVLQKN